MPLHMIVHPYKISINTEFQEKILKTDDSMATQTFENNDQITDRCVGDNASSKICLQIKRTPTKPQQTPTKYIPIKMFLFQHRIT